MKPSTMPELSPQSAVRAGREPRAARPSHTPPRMSRGLAAVVALGAALLLPWSAQAAGEVEVSWIEPEQFRDAGLGTFERDRNLRTLEDHFNRLGRHLPEGQTLRIEVADVDLAGEVWPFGHRDYRLVRGGIDWPRIELTWTLSDGEKVLAQGEDRVADMNYMFGRRMSAHQGPLPYERRMLEDWFQQRVASEALAGR